MARPPLPVGTYGKIAYIVENGTTYARVTFRDLDGVSRTVRRAGRSRAAAERSLKAALLNRQAPAKAGQITSSTRTVKVAELWFAELERGVDEGSRSPGTLDTYRSNWRCHVEPHLGALRISEVTTPAVDRALRTISDSSVTSARTAKIIVSGIMRMAARHGAILYNPVREVGRIESKPRRRPTSLTAAERTQWLDALDHDPAAQAWDLPDLTRIMLATGCRVGEALALGWHEVDLDGGTIDVRWHLVRRTGVGLIRLPSTKSGEKGERLLPIPAWAIHLLHQRRALIGPDVEPVFPDSLGGWRDPSNVRRVWRSVRTKAEMYGLVTHTLRKTVASHLDDADVSVRRISDQLGHAKVSMTQDHYLGRRLTDRTTADILENVLDAPKPSDNRP